MFGENDLAANQFLAEEMLKRYVSAKVAVESGVIGAPEEVNLLSKSGSWLALSLKSSGWPLEAVVSLQGIEGSKLAGN